MDSQKAITAEENADFPSDAVKQLQNHFKELHSKSYGGIGCKLKQTIEWLLQYLVPNVTRPFHRDIETIIFSEASKNFIFHLFQENLLYVVEGLRGIQSSHDKK